MIQKSHDFSRSDFIKITTAGALAGMLPRCSSLSNKKRPNILFIITDDQSWEHAGCYGDQAVRTPL